MNEVLDEQLKQQWGLLSKERKSIILDDSYRMAIHALKAGGVITDEQEDDVVMEALLTIIDLQTLAQMQEVLLKEYGMDAAAVQATVEEVRKLIGTSPVTEEEVSTPTNVAPHVCSPISVIGQDTKMQDRLQKLPVSVQAAITSNQHTSTFQGMCSQYSLDEAKARLLCEQIARVMLGIATTKDLDELLSGGTVVNTTKAKELMASIEANMLAPVRAAIIETLEAKGEGKGGVRGDPYKEPVS